MGCDLLEVLTGRRAQSFAAIRRVGASPRVAWYPTAGTDFRDLLYLGAEYQRLSPPTPPPPAEPAAPDLYLHTDYLPPSFLNQQTLVDDGRTTVRVEEIRELPRLNLPVEPGLVVFPGGANAGRVILLDLAVHSDVLGEFRRTVIYGIVENAAFCARVLLPSRTPVTHLVRVRHGGGCGGGGRASGMWLDEMARSLRCQVIVADGTDRAQEADEAVFEIFPSLSGARASPPDLREIRRIPGSLWSGHGDVRWLVPATT
jgi:hypothetical protein